MSDHTWKLTTKLCGKLTSKNKKIINKIERMLMVGKIEFFECCFAYASKKEQDEREYDISREWQYGYHTSML